MTWPSLSIRKLWLGRQARTKSDKLEQVRAVQLYIRGRALARVGAYDLAAAAFERAVVLDPMLDAAFESLGEALDILGQSEFASVQYAAARQVRAKLRPGAPDRHFVLRQRGHFTGEILAYDAVIRSLKKNALPYIARGNAHLASGQAEAALANYNRALGLKRGLPAVAALKGEALSMLGRYDEAVRSFDVALRAHPDDAEALGGRAIARLGLGLLEEANADWKRQFVLLGSRASARACVALRMADWASAVLELERALEKEPGDPYWTLYQLTARHRLGMPAVVAIIPSIDAWPGPLLALYADQMTPAEVLARADTENRRAEAAFQLGLLAFDRDHKAAESYWKSLIEDPSPSLIEHAAARNELARRTPSRTVNERI